MMNIHIQQVNKLIAKVQNLLSGSKFFTLHYSLFTIPFSLFPLLALTACSDDVEDVFGESAATRVSQARQQYYDVLEGNAQGWALDYYPSDGIEGGVAYTARFQNGRVTMACEQRIVNTDISTTYPLGTEVESAYRIVGETGILLTFDTYNALFHYWSQPFKGHAKGYESDYEFTFLSACADSVVLRGKKHGNMLRMYPLRESATQYINKVAAMHVTLESITRKRAVVDGQALPVTMAYNLFTYSDHGTRRSVPFVHTPDGIRFYQPVTLGGVTTNSMTFDSDSQELRTADGRIVLPRPTAIEQTFIAPRRQWLFSYKWSTGEPSDMCDELRDVIKGCADIINQGVWGEKVRELYLGANMESFATDRHRWVLGWHTRMSGIDFYIGYAIDMELTDASRQVATIELLEAANLFSNYGYWQPFVDFIGQHSPYLLQFNDPDNPTEVTLVSERDSSKWFKLKIK